jgi:GDP-4-dehydro-6-deoxy-D-mannose reductase
MNKKTALITGVQGFFGSHLLHLLSSKFPQLTLYGVVKNEGTAGGAAKTVRADLLDRNAVADMLLEIRPDYIFHLAGVIYSRDWQELYQGNVEITANLLDITHKQNSGCRFIMPGSASEYGHIFPGDLPLTEEQALNPISPYGVAKAWQTTLARYYAKQGADVVIGRVFNVIGRGVSENLSIGAFISQLKKINRGELPPSLRVGNLSPKRDFIDIEDACEGLISLALQGRKGEVYNICSGSSLSMQTVLDLMMKTSGIQATVTVDPERIKSTDIADIYGSYRKINQETGWRPAISLEDSIARLFL